MRVAPNPVRWSSCGVIGSREVRQRGGVGGAGGFDVTLSIILSVLYCTSTCAIGDDAPK